MEGYGFMGLVTSGSFAFCKFWVWGFRALGILGLGGRDSGYIQGCLFLCQPSLILSCSSPKSLLRSGLEPVCQLGGSGCSMGKMSYGGAIYEDWHRISCSAPGSSASPCLNKALGSHLEKQPSTLDPKPSTLNPKHLTLNTKPTLLVK